MIKAAGLVRGQTPPAGTTNQVLTKIDGTDYNEQWTGLSAFLDTLGSTRGAILYRGVSGWSLLAPGTSGYVLASSGSGADPSWQVAASAGLVTISSGTATTQTLTFATPINVFRTVTSGNTTYSFSGATDGYELTLTVQIGTAGHTLTFSGVTWPNNSAAPTWPTTVNARIIMTFLCESTTVRCTGYTLYTS